MTPANPRHVACTRCRARKVKCDGRRPWCRGCSGSGEELACSYETKPSKVQQKASSARQSRGLNTPDQLHQSQPRLDQVESYQEDLPDLLLQLFDSQHSEPSNKVPVLDGNNNNNDIQSMYLDDLLYAVDLTYPVVDTSVKWQQTGQTSPTVEEFQGLYDDYFATHDRSLSLLDQKEFLRSINVMTTEWTALRYAICAIVCISRRNSIQSESTGLSLGVARQFYESSKYMLESIKGNDNAIRILQTTILLMLYELMTADFSKAWTTMSRAHWLTDSMQLSKLCKQSWTSDRAPNEIILAYRAVITLNTFFSIGMSSSFMLSGEIVNETLPLVDSSQSQWQTFTNTDDLASAWPGEHHITTTIILLCHRIIANTRSIDSTDLHNNKYQTARFQQHKLEKDLRCITNLSSINALRINQTDIPGNTDEQLMCKLLLKTASLLLHESSLLLLEKEDQPLLGTDTTATALTTSTQKALELAQLLQTATLGAVTRTNIFLPWIFDITIKVLKRQQQYSTTPSGIQDIQALSMAEGQLLYSAAISSPPGSAHSNFRDASSRLGSFSSSSASSSSRHLDSLSTASSLNFTPQLSYADFTSKSENFLVAASIAALKTSLQKLRLSSPLAAWFDDQLDNDDANAVWNRRQKIGLVDFVSMP